MGETKAIAWLAMKAFLASGLSVRVNVLFKVVCIKRGRNTEPKSNKTAITKLLCVKVRDTQMATIDYKR